MVGFVLPVDETHRFRSYSVLYGGTEVVDKRCVLVTLPHHLVQLLNLYRILMLLLRINYCFLPRRMLILTVNILILIFRLASRRIMHVELLLFVDFFLCLNLREVFDILEVKFKP